MISWKERFILLRIIESDVIWNRFISVLFSKIDVIGWADSHLWHHRITHFPALFADYLLCVFIGSLCCLPLFRLVIVIAVILVLRHSVEDRSPASTQRTTLLYRYCSIRCIILFILRNFLLSKFGTIKDLQIANSPLPKNPKYRQSTGDICKETTCMYGSCLIWRVWNWAY